jgi:hypothetical protein
MRSNALVMALLALAVLVASPATAAKRRMAKHTVSCKQIRDAVASGKSADEVAKDLKVTGARVKSCTTPAAKHHGGHRAAAK